MMIRCRDDSIIIIIIAASCSLVFGTYNCSNSNSYELLYLQSSLERHTYTDNSLAAQSMNEAFHTDQTYNPDSTTRRTTC